MKHLKALLLLPFLCAYTPLSQDGSTDGDSTVMQERIEQAHQNRLEQEEALRIIREEKKEQIQEEQAQEGAEEKKMNEAEKLVR